MKPSQPVDFDTYYILEIFESAMELAQQKLQPEEVEQLEKFSSWFKGQGNFHAAIEELAHYQVTGDLAIFFSDLLEQNRQIGPEEAIKRLPGLAGDLLQMFREIVTEPEWSSSFGAKFKTTEKEERLGFAEFINIEIPTRIAEKISEDNPQLRAMLRNYLEKIIKEPGKLDVLQQYLDDEDMPLVARQLLELLQPPESAKLLITYIEQFYMNCQRAAAALEDAWNSHPEKLKALLQGEKAEVTEVDIDKLAESMEALEANKKVRPAMTEEDRQLRWMLKDYINHELESLTGELEQSIQNYNLEPSKSDFQNALLNVIKIIKDLGQIHRYYGIEETAGQLHKLVAPLVRNEKRISEELSDALLNVCRGYPEYIDDVLNDQESAGLEKLEALCSDVEACIKAAPAGEEGLSIEDPQVMDRAFVPVHNFWINQILTELETPQDAGVCSHALQQLQNLYRLIRRPAAEKWANALATAYWADEPTGDLAQDAQRISEMLRQVQENFSRLSEEDFEAFLKDIAAIPPVETVAVEEARPALREVLTRKINVFLEAVSGEDTPAAQITGEAVRLANSILEPADWVGLQTLKTVFQEISELENADEEVIQNAGRALPKLFRELEQLLKSEPETADFEPFLEKVQAIKVVEEEVSAEPIAATEEEVTEESAETIEEVGEEAAESVSAESAVVEEVAEAEAPPEEKSAKVRREEFVDDEIRQVFRSEATKYLQEMADRLAELGNEPDNRKVLNQLGKVTHTLKGSAQMLNQSAIAELAAPMEQLVDRIEEGEINIVTEFFPLFEQGITLLNQTLSGEAVEKTAFLEQLEQYISDNQLVGEEIPEELAEEETGEAALEAAAAEPALEPETEIPEVPLLKLSEQDPEMIALFKNETEDNLAAIESNLTLIEKFSFDKATLQNLDREVHEVRSAAKMLGFSEIGELTDAMEEIVEECLRQHPNEWSEIVPPLRKSVSVIKELVNHQQVPEELYQDAVSSLRQGLKYLQAVEEKAEEGVPAAAKEEPVEAALQPSRQVMEAFLQESHEYIEDINFLLMKLEKAPADDELCYHLLRSIHTLKGSAAMVYVEPVEKLAHRSEDILEQYHERKIEIPQAAIDLLFDVLDEIGFVVETLDKGLPIKTRQYDELLDRLNQYFREHFPAVAAEEAEPEKEEAAKAPAAPEKAAPPKPLPEIGREAYIRLRVEQMDKLLNQAAEQVISHTQFKSQLDRFKNVIPRLETDSKTLQNVLWYLETVINEEKRIAELVKPYIQNIASLEEAQKNQIESIERIKHNLQVFYNGFSQTVQGIKDSTKNFDEQIQKMNRVSTSIHEEIMEARLVPIGILFQRFPRPLRDIARKNNKSIKVIIEGENTELDRTLIEKLYEPLLHILRNAVDHGIEPPEERRELDKDEEGQIVISANQERNFVAVEIRDDGRGIDVEAVKKRALEMGLVDESGLNELSESEILEFIMHPGFSTAKQTTDLSGRGVGLDVVRNEIQKIKGDIRVYSEPGKGTRFLIRVPISLTVTQAMLVEVSGNIYAIPLMQVEETLNLTYQDLEEINGVYHLRHRGMVLPIIHLANLLQIRSGQRKTFSKVGEYPAIVVQDEGHRVVLLMDRIVQREEILIKSLGPTLQQVKFITGGSVLADGKVVLVLDVPQIIRDAINLKTAPGEIFETEKEAPAPAEKPATSGRQVDVKPDRPAKILVVDDSLSIRKFLSGLLTENGYDVDMAKNGYHALEKLNRESYDLLVTDLEMPQLSGYELIEQVRAESRWDKMPIIVLTGRASKHIQKVTLSLGADEFIVKPFKENDLLEKIRGFLKI
ncbi:MAG: hypothetical protein Kow0037_18480 [Calditrichia bacterium]